MPAMKIAELSKKYADGFSSLDHDDLEGYSWEDVRKLREDLEGDEHFVNVEEIDETRADDSGDRVVRYVLSTDNPVGSFGDVIVQRGWDLREFNQRGRPFLFHHNEGTTRPPLGRMENIQKDVTRKGAQATIGDARFTPAGLNEFNDLVHDMVRANFMPGGSVGFRVKEARPPTDEEMESKKGLRKFSSIYVKTNLVEFSATPVGADPSAVKIRTKHKDAAEAKLAASVADGTYDEELVAEFRHRMFDPSPVEQRTAPRVFDFGAVTRTGTSTAGPGDGDDPTTETGIVSITIKDDRDEDLAAMSRRCDSLSEEVAELRTQLGALPPAADIVKLAERVQSLEQIFSLDDLDTRAEGDPDPVDEATAADITPPTSGERSAIDEVFDLDDEALEAFLEADATA